MRQKGDTSPSAELSRVLGLLDEVQKASAAAEPPPVKPPEVPRRSPAELDELFGPVHVEGEDHLARLSSDEKVAILRQKVRAFEDRFRDIRKVWNTISQATQREKRLREDAEGRVRKLNAFLLEKKKDFEEYQRRVQAALEELAGREQKAIEEHARVEREALNEHSRYEREAVAQEERLQRDLRERAEQAERRLAEVQRAAAELLPASDIAKIAHTIDESGRGISSVLQGNVSDTEGVEILRTALRRLKRAHQRLVAALAVRPRSKRA